ncbi:hypothetical protein KC573_01990 [candidate division WWE3 bacterium]|uniref:SurA N-terminal domain-containing protein n=1 Tax=candidate division WWE3 bacterium TaxID=2053526 RepID=A0A955LWN1_UNCKA|nr:hypothetical protein [candidate division WWE3 bacterium]
MDEKNATSPTPASDSTTSSRVAEFNNNLSFNLNSKTAFISIGIIVLFALAYYTYTKGIIVAAMVNGTPITRYSVIQELESTQGKQILDAQIDDILIIQEAEKQNVTVTTEEVDSRIGLLEADFEEQGGLDLILDQEGLTREQLKRQIQIQLLAEKILETKISITDEEIATYIETNRDYFPEDMTDEELQDNVRQQLRQEKLSTAYQTWIMDLRNNSSINYLVDY